MTATLPPTRAASSLPVATPAPFERAVRALRVSGDELGPTARIVSRALGAVAALALWLVLFGLVLSGLGQSHAQTDLYDQFRGELAAGTAPIAGPIAPGSPVAVLTSPAAGLHRVVVVEGTSSEQLRDGPGHYPGYPLPGQAGVSLLMGRSTSFGAPFAGLGQLRAGDAVTVQTGQGRFVYVVQDVRRPGDRLPAPLAVGAGRLTLVTAAGDGWRSGWAPSYALYVDARLEGRPAPSTVSSGVPTAADGALSNSTGGLYPLVLWLQLLAATVVGGAWLRGRWSGSRVWLIVVPVGLAALWGASQEFWLLLPNLL